MRLTEALLPLLRATAAATGGQTPCRRWAPRRWRSSTWPAPPAGSRDRDSGAYSAAKFALAGWTDALYGEEAAHGVHVGLVLPGFVAHRGLPGRRAAAPAPGPGGWSPSPRASPRRSSPPGPAARPSATSRAGTGWPRRCGSWLRAGPPRDGGGWAGHRHQGRRRPARPLTRRLRHEWRLRRGSGDRRPSLERSSPGWRFQNGVIPGPALIPRTGWYLAVPRPPRYPLSYTAVTSDEEQARDDREHAPSGGTGRTAGSPSPGRTAPTPGPPTRTC